MVKGVLGHGQECKANLANLARVSICNDRDCI